MHVGTECRDINITGNALTPFLLARVSDLTGGASLASSILYIVLHNQIDTLTGE